MEDYMGFIIDANIQKKMCFLHWQVENVETISF